MTMGPHVVTHTFVAPVSIDGVAIAALRLAEPRVRDVLDLGPIVLRPTRRYLAGLAVDVPGRAGDYIRRLALDIAPDTLDALLDALGLAEGLRLRAVVASLVPDTTRDALESCADGVALDWAQATIPDIDTMKLSQLADIVRRLHAHSDRVARRRRS